MILVNSKIDADVNVMVMPKLGLYTLNPIITWAKWGMIFPEGVKIPAYLM